MLGEVKASVNGSELGQHLFEDDRINTRSVILDSQANPVVLSGVDLLFIIIYRVLACCV